MNATIGIITSWLATYLVLSTLLLGTAWLLTKTLVRTVSLQERLWKYAMIAAVIGSVLITANFPLRSADNTPAPVIVSRTVETPPVQIVAPSIVANSDSPQRPGGRTVGRSVALELAIALVGAWLLGVIACLVRLEIGRRKLFRSIGKRGLVTREQLLREVSAAKELARFDGPLCLTSSSQLVSPIAIGTSEIAISEEFIFGLPAEQRLSAFAHEIAHLARRDPRWRTIASTISAIFFFQPLNWIAAKKIRDCAEFLCDDAASQQNGEYFALAECLTAIAQRMHRTNRYAVALGGEPTMLVRRVTRLLQPVDRRLPNRLTRVALVMSMFVLAAASPRVSVTTNVWAKPVPAASSAQKPAPISDSVRRKGTIIPDDTELEHTHEVNGVIHEQTTFNGGRILLRDDRTGYETILPGGYLRLTTIAGGNTRHVEIRVSAAGIQSRLYSVNGVPSPFDAAAEAWVQKSVARFTRSASFSHKKHR